MPEVSSSHVVMSRRSGGRLPGGRTARLGALILVLIAALVPATAEASFGPATFLSNSNRDAFEPQVGMDNTGKGYATWERFDGQVLRIQARVRSASGKYGKTFDLSGANRDAFSPQVAVNGTGNALFVWTRFDGTNDRIQARTRSASGTVGSVLSLSDPGRDGEEAQVGIDSNGNAFAVWTRSDGTNLRIGGTDDLGGRRARPGAPALARRLRRVHPADRDELGRQRLRRLDAVRRAQRPDPVDPHFADRNPGSVEDAFCEAVRTPRNHRSG